MKIEFKAANILDKSAMSVGLTLCNRDYFGNVVCDNTKLIYSGWNLCGQVIMVDTKNVEITAFKKINNVHMFGTELENQGYQVTLKVDD